MHVGDRHAERVERPARQKVVNAKAAVGTEVDQVSGARTTALLSKTQINLKLFPGVDGRAEVCQLVAYNLTDVTVKGSRLGPARLHIVPHVNAPVADLPVRKIVGAHHFVADVTLPYGRVLSTTTANVERF
jgi:acetoacetate decarboxylase